MKTLIFYTGALVWGLIALAALALGLVYGSAWAVYLHHKAKEWWQR